MADIYFQKFDVRWSDIDANRHLANTSYIQYASHTRLSFLAEHGFGQKSFAEYKIGPAALHEQMFFFKEMYFSDELYVGLQLSGISEDGMYFMFRQPMHRKDGRNVALCTVKGTWIDIELRKPTIPPALLMGCINEMPRSDDFRIIDKNDLRDKGFAPVHIDPFN